MQTYAFLTFFGLRVTVHFCRFLCVLRLSRAACARHGAMAPLWGNLQVPPAGRLGGSCMGAVEARALPLVPPASPSLASPASGAVLVLTALATS